MAGIWSSQLDLQLGRGVKHVKSWLALPVTWVLELKQTSEVRASALTRRSLRHGLCQHSRPTRGRSLATKNAQIARKSAVIRVFVDPAEPLREQQETRLILAVEFCGDGDAIHYPLQP